MLVGVGCKDYDDDLNKVNDRIDGLETGKIASIEDQVSKINASISSLDAAYKAADAALKTALDKQIADLAAAKTTLEASIEALKTSTTTDITKLKGDLSALGTKVDGINTALAAEIKKVSDKLDNYTNTADMKAYVQAELAKLDAKFAGEIAALKTRLDLAEAAIDGIKETIEQMKTQIAGKVNQSDYDTFTQKTNEAIQTNAEALSVLKTLVGDFSDLAEGQTIRTYIDQAIEDVTTTLTNFKTEYDAFVLSFGEYKVGIETRLSTTEAALEELTKVDGTIAGINSEIERLEREKATIEDVNALFVEGNNAFTTGVNDVLAKALADGGAISEALKGALETLRGEYKGTLEQLANRVADLEDRIQSLVYIPNNAIFKGIVVNSAPYIVMEDAAGQDVNVSLGEIGAQEATLEFIVSPAAVAKRITTETISLITSKINVSPTRAGEPVFAVKSVTTDAVTGKIAIVATTDYMFGSEENKTLAVAVRVAIPNATADKQGIDYTSEFIPAMYDPSAGEVDAADLVIAKEVEDGEFAEPAANVFASTLVYTDVATTVTFLKDFSVYYKKAGAAGADDEYIKLAEMWANAPTLDIKVPTAVATVAPTTNAANYTLTATTAKIKTSAAVLIDEVISSGDYTFTLKSGANKLEIGKVKQTVTIKVDSKDIATDPIAMSWIYNATPALQAYTSDFINLNKNNNSKLSAAEFKVLKTKTPTIKVLDAENADVSATVVPALTIENEPATDGDSQMIRVKLTGDLQKTAAYKVVVTYADVFPNVVITAPVNVTGVPVITPAAVTKAAVYSVDSTFYIAVPNFKKTIWDAMTVTQKQAFTDFPAFETAFAGTFAVVSDATKSKLTIEDGKDVIKGVAVTFGTDTKSGVVQTVEGTITNAWGMNVKYTVNATLTLPTALMAKGDNLTGNAELGYKLEATPVIDGATFALTNMSLNFAYFYDKAATGAVQADVEYVINEDAAAVTAAGVSISGTALTWGTWAEKQGKRELKVTAKLKYGVFYLDTKNFTVWYQDPVPAAITVASEAAKKVLGATTTTQTMKIADLLTLNVTDKSAGDVNIFDGAATSGLNADLVTALGGKVVYSAMGVSGDRVKFDPATGVLSVAGSNDSSFGDPQTVNVTVKYTYNHMTQDAVRTVVIPITVKQAEVVVP